MKISRALIRPPPRLKLITSGRAYSHTALALCFIHSRGQPSYTSPPFLDSTFTNKSRATRRLRMCAIASVANLARYVLLRRLSSECTYRRYFKVQMRRL
jgi:hypothetical protein